MLFIHKKINLFITTLKYNERFFFKYKYIKQEVRMLKQIIKLIRTRKSRQDL